METEKDKYLRAVAHTQQLRKFYGKIINSVILVSIFAAFNYYINELKNPWFLWVAGFALLGIVIDFFKLYGATWFLGKGWEQRKIKEQMEKDDQNVNSNLIRKS